MKVYIETFGCTFNKGDSEIMAGFISQEDDFEIVDSLEEAETAIINTCYVKQATESKITNYLKTISEEHPEINLIVSGCMVEIDSDRIDKIAPNASCLGPHQLKHVNDVIKYSYNGEPVKKQGFSKDKKVGMLKLRTDPLIHIIQICEGCLGKCSYCCTRFARGPLNSYPIDELVEEAKEAIADGCVEIQLTAQDTAAFGKDTNEKLSDLIKRIALLDEEFRVRVGMMHPNNMMDDIDSLIEAFKMEKVYKFIHLPVQTGSDKVLKEMKRGHTIQEFKDVINKFKEEIPDMSIATDIIVAYPTENEDDFKASCDLINEIKPSFIHLSKYKHRPKATSRNLKEVPKEEMKRRSKILTEIKEAITEKENEKFLNSEMRVLIVEKGSKGGVIAKSDSYIPVVLKTGKLGTFENIKITETTRTYLKGEKI